MSQVSPVLTGNYGPMDWLSIAKTKSESLYKVRESALAWWAKANGFHDPNLLFSLVKRNEQDAYEAAKKMMDVMAKERAKTTINTYRSAILTFYKFADIPFKEELFELRVPMMIAAPSNSPRTLTKDQLRALLETLELPWRALVLFLLNTGWRVSEPFKVTMADLNGDLRPTRVHLEALDSAGNPTNKTRRDLNGFLSSECTSVLREWIKGFKSTDPLFPDMNADKAYYHIMAGLKRLNLTERHGYLDKFTIHPHTFRSLNLAMVKRWGFDSDWAEALASHEVGVRISYDILDEMAESWLEKVEPNMRFLS